MPLLGLADDLAGPGVECGEEAGGAVALALISLLKCIPRLDRLSEVKQHLPACVMRRRL